MWHLKIGKCIEGILIEWEDGFKSSSVSPSRRVLWVLLTHFTFNWTLFKFIRLYSTLKLLKIFKKILNHPKWQATLGRSHACSIIGSDSSAIFEKWTTSIKFRHSDPIETINTTTKTLNSSLIIADSETPKNVSSKCRSVTWMFLCAVLTVPIDA